MKPHDIKRAAHPTGPRRISDSLHYMYPSNELDVADRIRFGAPLSKRTREIQLYVAKANREDPRHPDTGGNLETRQ